MQFSREPIITIRLLLFGAVAEAAGFRVKEMELYDRATVGDVHASLRATYPKLEGMKVKYAVDEQFCSGRHLLADKEDVAIFTAVSGG